MGRNLLLPTRSCVPGQACVPHSLRKVSVQKHMKRVVYVYNMYTQRQMFLAWLYVAACHVASYTDMKATGDVGRPSLKRSYRYSSWIYTYTVPTRACGCFRVVRARAIKSKTILT